MTNGNKDTGIDNDNSVKTSCISNVAQKDGADENIGLQRNKMSIWQELLEIWPVVIFGILMLIILVVGMLISNHNSQKNSSQTGDNTLIFFINWRRYKSGKTWSSLRKSSWGYWDRKIHGPIKPPHPYVYSIWFHVYISFALL